MVHVSWSVDRLMSSLRGQLVRLFPCRRDQFACITLLGCVRANRPSIRRARVSTFRTFFFPVRHQTVLLTPPPSVISITTHSAVLSSKDAPLNKLSSGGGLFGSRRSGGSRQSSWLAFFVKFLFLVGVAAGAAYGYKTYMIRSRRGGLSSAGTLGMGFGDRSYGSRRRF